MNPVERYSMTQIFAHPWMKNYYDYYKIDVHQYVKGHDLGNVQIGLNPQQGNVMEGYGSRRENKVERIDQNLMRNNNRLNTRKGQYSPGRVMGSPNQDTSPNSPSKNF